MKKRGVLWILAIVILLVILTLIFIYSKYQTSSQKSEETLNTLFKGLSFLYPVGSLERYVMPKQYQIPEYTGDAASFVNPIAPPPMEPYSPVVLPSIPGWCNSDSQCGPLFEMPTIRKCQGANVVQDYTKKVCVNNRCEDRIYSKSTPCSGNAPYCLNGWCVECIKHEDCNNGVRWEIISESCNALTTETINLFSGPYHTDRYGRGGRGTFMEAVCSNFLPDRIWIRTGSYELEFKEKYCSLGRCMENTFSYTEQCPEDWYIDTNLGSFGIEPVCNGNLCVNKCWNTGDCRSYEKCIGAQLPPNNKPFPGTCIVDASLMNPTLLSDCGHCPGLSVCSTELSGKSCCRPEDPNTCSLFSFNKPVCVLINSDSTAPVIPTPIVLAPA